MFSLYFDYCNLINFLFGSEGGSWVLIAPVSCHCILVTLT